MSMKLCTPQSRSVIGFRSSSASAKYTPASHVSKLPSRCDWLCHRLRGVAMPVSAPTFETPNPLPLFPTRNVFVQTDSATTVFPTPFGCAHLETATITSIAINDTHCRQTNSVMGLFKKRETDIEMEAMRGQKKDTVPDDTEYRPINWRKIFLSPKYIRKTCC
jgi:hypothetical protein